MKGKFYPGSVFATPGALRNLEPDDVWTAIVRHLKGDWGDVDSEDWEANEYALKYGLRLLSSYRSNGTKFWIITEADRSATTILLPEDY